MMRLNILITLCVLIHNALCTVPTFNNIPQAPGAACVDIDENEDNKRTLLDVDACCVQGAGENKIKFSMTSNPAGPFKIKDNDGKIENYKDPGLDYAYIQQYVMTVCAYDEDNPSDVICEDVTICVNPVYFSPVWTNMPTTLTVAEDITVPSTEYKVQATDSDGDDLLFYVLAAYPSPSPFIVNADSGDVVAAGVIDYETEQQYILTVQCFDGRYFIEANLTIDITDANEPPMFTNMPGTSVVYESEVNNRLVYTADVFQDDADTLTSSLSISPADGPFYMDFVGTQGFVYLNFSVGVGALDAETQNSYTLTVDVTDGTTAISDNIDITVQDVNEGPVIDNLPHYETIAEDATLAFNLVTVTATDPEGDTLNWVLSVSPYDGGAFSITAGGGVVKMANNPGLDYEVASAYNMTVYVDDGSMMGPAGYVFVTITDANDPPVIQNLPTYTNFTENTRPGRTIFKVRVIDQDISDNVTYTIQVNPYSGQNFIEIDGNGVIRSTASADFNYEVLDTYTVTVTVTDAAGLTDSQILTMNIENRNERPVFTNTEVIISIDEELAIGTVLTPLIEATDVDIGDNLTYILPSVASTGNFGLNTSTEPPILYIASTIDREDVSKPYYFDIPILARDSGYLQDVMSIKVTILDIDDNAPIFTNQVYSGWAQENGIASTKAVATLAVDADSGVNADFVYSLAGGGLCSKYFQVQQDGDITVKQGIDIETYPSVNCTVYATSTGGKSGNATAIITITDDNDNQPYFKEGFYSFEVPADADIGEFAGWLQGHDNDTSETGSLNYFLMIPSAEFRVESSSGVIEANNPLPEYRSYVLYAFAQDNGNPPQTSLQQWVRVDTYVACECLVDVVVLTSGSYFKSDSNKATFTSALQGITGLSDGLVKIVYINGQDPYAFGTSTSLGASSKVTILVIKGFETTVKEALDTVSKQFYTVSELLTIMQTDSSGSPSSYVTLATAGLFTVNKVNQHEVCSTIPPDVNWWLETGVGIFTTVLLCLLAAVLMAALIAAAVYGIRRLHDYMRPIRPRLTPVKEAAPRYMNEGEFDFRHNPRDGANEFRQGRSPPPAYSSPPAATTMPALKY